MQNHCYNSPPRLRQVSLDCASAVVHIRFLAQWGLALRYKLAHSFARVHRRYDMNGRFQMQGGKTVFCRKRWMQSGSSGTLIGLEIWSNHFCPSIWDRMEGAWLWTQTLPPFGPIEGHNWFFHISNQWESQKNRSALALSAKSSFDHPVRMRSPVHVVPPQRVLLQ